MSARKGLLGAAVRLLLRLFPEDVPGITRQEMEETVFDRLAGEGERSRPRLAIRVLGDLAWAGAAERLGSWRRLRLAQGLAEDVRFGVRSLIRSPVFALGAVIMLALGIGATNAMFGMSAGMSRIADRFREPDELVFLWRSGPGWRRASVSAEDVRVWRAQATAFQDMGIHTSVTRYVTGGEEPVRTTEVRVSSNLFPMLGFEAEIGRLPGPADDEPTAEPVVVLTWRMWQERFGGEPDVLGRIVTLDDVAHTVIGVLPRTVDFELLWRGAGVVTPLSPLSMESAAEATGDRPGSGTVYRVMARLSEGVSSEQAQAQMDVLAARVAGEVPSEPDAPGVTVEPFREFFYSRDDRLAMGSLILAVVAVLLIACVNLANLLLARGTARQGEVAVRMAVGARRWQIVRRLLVESFVLAVLGGAAGIVLGLWGVKLLVSSLPTSPFMADEVALDPTLLLFTLVVSTAAALAFGLAPALLASRVSVGAGLKESGAAASSSRARKRFRDGILVGQIALTVPLVLTCVVAFRHIRALESVDFGMETESLLTAQVDLPRYRYPDGAQQADFFRRAHEAVATLPGVSAVGAGVDVPIGAGSRTQVGPLVVEGREAEEGEARRLGGYKVVTPGFFRALGVPLVAGRELGPDDGPNDLRVAVVNEAMARRYWPGEDAVGRRLIPDTSRYLGPEWSASPPITVVGVVRDFGATFYGEPPSPTVYLPHAQHPVPSMLLVVSAGGDPSAAVAGVRKTLGRLDPGVPTSSFRTGEALVDTWLRESRVTAATLGLLGVLALGLAVLGLYGMVAYSVAQRTFELGVRMVLGADRHSVRLAVMRSFLVLSGVGIVIGLGISALAAAAARSQLVMLRVSVTSTGGIIAALLVAVVLVASYVPARRATRIEPVRALRCE